MQAHFVEADPWVVERVLGKNIATCGAEYHTTVHTQYVEPFLRRMAESPDVRLFPCPSPCLYSPGAPVSGPPSVVRQLVIINSGPTVTDAGLQVMSSKLTALTAPALQTFSVAPATSILRHVIRAA